MVGEFFSVLSKSTASGSRSTALYDVRWLLGMTLLAFLAVVWLNAPALVIGLMGALLGIAFLLNCAAYLYLLIQNPDALRSESFTLNKMRLEKGLVGDSTSGFREVTPGEVVLALPSGPARDDRP